MEFEERLVRLEKRLFRARLLLGVVLVVSVVALWRTSRDKEDAQVHVAAGFSLVDPSGRVLTRLVAGPAGPRLEMIDVAGRPRITLDVSASGPGLTMFDARGQERALLALGPAGPYLGLTDKDGTDLFSAPMPHTEAAQDP